ncbi:PAS domain S-box-containing protein [Rhodopseudomonas rhenobacensis]|uniref:histidine kinase n=1 Tax=Rhodopseudomonas rhenobacensis TaxID=87461 RepID=A0A7W7Z763_9BRAD|nr:PAS domain-containing protein [Rhodopseudomonas rhenobacensis]MBB5049253.1 PAS domain S-box-containing protein [Rhodopseudomonas rhenobacensis]
MASSDTAFLRGGGETGALIADFDWQSTSLGPIASWPQSLKTVVGVVVHSAVPIVMLWGPDGFMIYNDAYSEFAGARHPALLGSKVREGWPEVADFNDNVMRIVLGGRSLAYRDQKLTLYRNGVPEPVWMNLDYSPVLDENGRPAGVIAVVVETTKRVQADQRVAAEQDRLLSLFEQAPGFMAMLEGPQHVFTLANHAFLQLIGHREVLGRAPLEALPELEGQGFLEVMDDCYRSGRPFVGNALKVSLQREVGGGVEDRFVDFVYQPVRDSAGEVAGIFVQGSDVTQRVAGDAELRRITETLEARVEERTAELAAANRQLVAQIEERERVEATLRQMQRLEAVGQLTSGVAHDFNNLLTVVLGNLGFLEKTLERAGVDGKAHTRLANIRTAAERGATLTAQLLAFSRRQRLETRAVDLNETVAKMRELLQSSMGGAVRLETVLQPDLWPALVDPTQIELVILNLAINARDAMEVGGSLTVETANVRLGAPNRPEMPGAGEYVMIAVADTGTGMTPEVLAKAFEPFFTTKPVGKGSGLGLAQVFGFAKQSGGGVRIDTKLGEGSTVKVFLPRAARNVGGRHVEAQEPPPLRGAMRRLLLVDDDSAVREVTAAMLREVGCVVVEAGSGGAALDILERDPAPFDLMVIDFAMPGMTGAEVAREAQLRRPGMPTIFITGYADLAALQNIGEEAIVQKPFRDAELLRKISRALGSGGAAGNVVQLRK